MTDRQLVGGYTLGLAAGLRADGVEVFIGAPPKTGVNSVTVIYPRSGVPGQRLGKARDGILGILRFNGTACHYAARSSPYPMADGPGCSVRN